MRQALNAKPKSPASMTDRKPRGDLCGRTVSHFCVQIGLNGIPQPVFLELIAGHSRLIRP